MTTKRAKYVDLDGREWPLNDLGQDERQLIAKLQRSMKRHLNSKSKLLQKWCDFDNHWLPLVLAFYKAKGVSRKEIVQTPVFQIAQDLSGRLAVSLGLVKKPDYRSGLSEIIDSQFKSRREFCEATGLTEDMLSHVLAGRKDLSIEALTNALDQMGFTIRFVRNRNVNQSA